MMVLPLSLVHRHRGWLLLIGLLGSLAGCTPKYVTNVPVEACPPTEKAKRHIRVDGIATVQVSPDVVDLQMTLSADAESPKPAVAKVRGQRDALVAALRAAGLSGGDLRLGHLDVTPRRKPHPDQHLLDGYRASITVVATIKDFERIGEIMELGATFGVTSMHTSFRSTKLSHAKAQARELALSAARTKAAQIARYLNVVVGEVLAIEEVSADSPSFGLDNNVVAMKPSGDAGQRLQPGALPLTLTVKVTFGLAAGYGGYQGYAPTRP
jgi:uncharacterized protein YggE